MSTFYDVAKQPQLDVKAVNFFVHCAISLCVAQTVISATFSLFNAVNYCYPAVSMVFHLLSALAAGVHLACSNLLHRLMRKVFPQAAVDLSITQRVMMDLFDVAIVFCLIRSPLRLSWISYDYEICNKIIRQ